MKKLNYLTAIAIILTVSFIGFSSFSTSDTKAVETIEIDGLTYEVAGEYNAQKIVKVYQALETSWGDSKPIFEYGKSNMSQLGNYSSYEKARAICDQLLKNSGSYDGHTVYVQEVLALESKLSRLQVK